jgi:hypothetical protein
VKNKNLSGSLLTRTKKALTIKETPLSASIADSFNGHSKPDAGRDRAAERFIDGSLLAVEEDLFLRRFSAFRLISSVFVSGE